MNEAIRAYKDRMAADKGTPKKKIKQKVKKKARKKASRNKAAGAFNPSCGPPPGHRTDNTCRT